MKTARLFLGWCLGAAFATSPMDAVPDNNRAQDERPIAVVMTSRNNMTWYEKSLASALNQNYSNYRIIYVDDASTDGSGDAVAKYVKEHDRHSRITLVMNTTRKYRLRNQYDAINSLDDWDIVVQLDGDDWFPHRGVLSIINSVYADKEVWITHSSCIPYRGEGKYGEKKYGVEACGKYAHIRSLIRTGHMNWCFRHPHTFYAWLFKKIRCADFLAVNVAGFKGCFYPVADDWAYMLPMVEMAQNGHVRVLSDVLYEYNVINPENHFRTRSEPDKDCQNEILARQQYAPIDGPPDAL